MHISILPIQIPSQKDLVIKMCDVASSVRIHISYESHGRQGGGGLVPKHISLTSTISETKLIAHKKVKSRKCSLVMLFSLPPMQYIVMPNVYVKCLCETYYLPGPLFCSRT